MPCGPCPGGAGTNNIPIDRCSEAGIVVFNTPGANGQCGEGAGGVRSAAGLPKDQRRRGWVKEQAAAGADVEQAVEKGKSQFVGPELSGKMLGVIGLGAIGVQVANIATKLGMTVFGYDPSCRWTELCPCPGWSTGPWIWRPFIRTATTSPSTCPRPPRPRECSTRTHSI